MCSYSHSWALVLEVYHILCSCSNINRASTQLWKVMTTEVSSNIGELLTVIANYTGGKTCWCIAFTNYIYTSSQAYRGIRMNLGIIYFTLKPIRRSMDETRDIVVTVSRMEQRGIGFKNFLCIIWKMRVWIRAFETLETMLNEPVVNYQRFVWFEGLVMLSSKRGLNCWTPSAVWEACVCLDVRGKVTGSRKNEHFNIILMGTTLFYLSFNWLERTSHDTDSI